MQGLRILRAEHRIPEHRESNLWRKAPKNGPNQNDGRLHDSAERPKELRRIRRPQGVNFAKRFF